MLTLNDGRNELWQWDTGRKLTVDADCSQVHFSNKVFGRSIDVDVVDGIAIIPDILLQTDKDLTAWAFVGTPENGYTKISKVFKVNRRNKPADYVFTPPEQTMLDELVERLDKIEESQDPDAIKNALEDYLDQNPVEAPVQSVNGKTGKVKLTAEDVGAISQEDLQEATNEALAQAKASGEFDGKDGIDGYTPIKGVDYFDGKDGQPGANGKDGQDYVLTEADKQEIAEQAAQLVEVPEGGEIPDALPNPYALTFTGAVNATYDGSKAVSVDIPSGGGGSGGGTLKRILDFTTTEEAAYIYQEFEPVTIKEFFVLIDAVSPATLTNTSALIVSATVNLTNSTSQWSSGGVSLANLPKMLIANAKRSGFLRIENFDGGAFVTASSQENSGYNGLPSVIEADVSTISNIRVETQGWANVMATGSRVRIYGVMA